MPRKLTWDTVTTPGQAHQLMVREGLCEPMVASGWSKPVKGHRRSLQRALNMYLDANPECLEQIVMGMVHRARMGDARVLAMLWDRIDGAVVKKTANEVDVHIKRYGFAEPRLVTDNEDEAGEAKEIG